MIAAYILTMDVNITYRQNILSDLKKLFQSST